MPGESNIKGFWGGKKEGRRRGGGVGVVVWSLGTPDVGA